MDLARQCPIGRLSTDVDTALLRVFAGKQVFSTGPLVDFTLIDFHFCILPLENAAILSGSHKLLKRDVVPLIQFRCLRSNYFLWQIVLVKNLLSTDRNILYVLSWAWSHG